MKVCIFVFLLVFTKCFFASTAFALRPPDRIAALKCPRTGGSRTANDLITYRFGALAGHNSSTVRNEVTSAQDDVRRFAAGVAAQVIWPNGFVLQPEVLYSQKGTYFGGGTVKFNIDYIELPVKFMYRIQLTHIKPFGFVAPYGAYLINAEQDGANQTSEHLSDQVAKYDYGLGVGAGFDIWFFQLSFRYSWGFARVLPEETESSRNRTFNVSLGLFF
jgi:hypothetical protein